MIKVMSLKLDNSESLSSADCECTYGVVFDYTPTVSTVCTLDSLSGWWMGRKPADKTDTVIEPRVGNVSWPLQSIPPMPYCGCANRHSGQEPGFPTVGSGHRPYCDRKIGAKFGVW